MMQVRTVWLTNKISFFMRTIVGDILGKCRIVDIWENKSISRFCGNEEDLPDRAWGIDSIKLFNDEKNACLLHNCGAASFVDIENESRTKILKFDDVKNGLIVDFQNDKFISGFDKKCITFNEDKIIGEFETIENPSCASIYQNKIAYGHLSDRTTIFDINEGKKMWVASEPPFDELKIQLDDNDRSILMYDDNVLIVGQNDSFILVYDIRQGNEAIIRTKVFNEFPIVAMSKLPNNNIVFGDTVGSLTIMELNALEKHIKGVKGFYGPPAGVLSISPHPTLPYFSVLSCDRVVRTYDYTKNSLQPFKTTFVRTLSNAIVMLNDEPPVPEDPSEDEWADLQEGGSDIWSNYVPCPQSKKNIKE